MTNESKPWSPATRYFVFVLALIACGAAIWVLRGIIRPLVGAALLAYILSPVVHLVSQRTKLNRKAAGNLVYFIGLGLLSLSLAIFVPLVLRQAQDVLQDLLKNLDALQTMLLAKPLSIGPFPLNLGMLIPSLRETYAGTTPLLAEQALRLLQATSRNLLWFLLIVVTTYYLMTDWDKLREWLIGLAPDSYQSDVRQLYTNIREIWLAYLGGQLRLMFILAVMFSLAWVVIGLPGGLILGMLAGVLNLMPEVGPLIAAMLAVLVAFVEGSSFLPLSNTWFAALVLGLYLLLNNVKTIFIQPRVLGRSVRLHEGVVFIAIITAIVVEGLLGVLVVVPLLASIAVVGRYLRRRLLGLPPFPEHERLPFVTRPTDLPVKPSRRHGLRRDSSTPGRNHEI
jgi:predicted PurR-regulated permease PerM